MDAHLSDDQIELLFQKNWSSKPESHFDPGIEEDAQNHLNNCNSCRARVQEQESAMQRLALLQPPATGRPGSQCPPEDVWVVIAAGIAGPDAENYLAHATQCDHCGPLLKLAFADITDDLTPAEEGSIRDLHSSTPRWQKSLARELSHSDISDTQMRTRVNDRIPWFASLLSPLRLSVAGAAAALVVFGVWSVVRLQNGSSPETLLANAYAEKRTMEVRIEGAPYVPMHQERGGSTDQGRMNRPVLLRAEAEIAEHLKANPENIAWLQASGRASLLEGGVAGTEQAIAVLDKAQELDPNDRSISVDLASAYLLRGEVADRPEDLGNAVEVLGKVLATEPQNETALFNDAVALEKLNLKTQAAEEWQKFLQLHSASPWAEEARQRLKRLQDEIQQHSQRSNQPLLPINELAAAFSHEREPVIDVIDSRLEEYQDAALQQWLPDYFAVQVPQRASLDSLRTALTGLATLLKDRHGDDWLMDMLSAGRTSSSAQDAVRFLAESERLIQTSDNNKAQAAASRASTLFLRYGIPAGRIRAQFDLAFIDQLQHDSQECEALANGLTHQQLIRYPWLQVQTRLEEAACASTSDQRALQLAQDAKSIAQQHCFPILALRAANFESGSYQADGDWHRAWATSADSFRHFWEGTFPPSRGYSLLVNLQDMAEEEQQSFLETAVLNEAVPMIASDPDNALRAFEEDRLGEAELRSEDVKGAGSSFRIAQQLFANVAPGPRRDALSAETEVGLAKAELDSGQPGDAVRRLDQVRPSITSIADDDLQLEFFQISGIARFRAGLQQSAKSDLHAAIQLAGLGLRQVDSEPDRWKWRRRNEPTYRTLVELELQSDPAQALRDWEVFKGATLQQRKDGHSKPAIASPGVDGATVHGGMAPGVSYISYAIFHDRTAVWISDESHMRQIWLSLRGPQLSVQIRRFVERCSNPDSNTDQIRQQAAELYQALLQPVEPWVAGHRMLSIEPDGPLRSLPFEILVNAQGEYLGDRFAVTISPGIQYLQRARELDGVTQATDISIIGNPSAPGWIPLPEAEQEARAVAALFSRPRLTLEPTGPGSNVFQQIDRAQLFHFSGHASATIQSAGLIVGSSGPLDALHIEDSKAARTQLAVLSACNSSRGSTGFFDDEDSFVRRLLGARVPAVVASRWMVDSAATSELMKRFYEALVAGEPVSDSLASARRAVRSKAQYAHPFYWAGFSVFGRS